MSKPSVLVGVCIADQHALDLDSFATAAAVGIDDIRRFVEEGLLEPQPGGEDWRFGGEALTRVRRIRRLQHDFDANLDSVAVMLDLLDEIARLRARLARAGLYTG